MRELEEDVTLERLKSGVLATVGRWALAILATMIGLGFAAGAWATKQEFRTQALETKQAMLDTALGEMGRTARRTDRNVSRIGSKLNVELEHE